MNFSLIAAAKFEVEPLKNALEHLGFTPEVHIIGIGAINAAKNARPISELCRGKDSVFVGTCGSFSDFSKPYLVTAREVCWLPTGDRLGFSYTVKDTAPIITCTKPSVSQINLPKKRIVCGPSISTVAKLPEGYVAEDCVENLELYSCIGELSAKVATLTTVLCVTNGIGPDAHRQWKENFASAATETAEYFKQILKMRAP